MMLKTILFVLAVFPTIGICQSEKYQWPIAGQTPGENVLYKPQDIIGGETNLDLLIIKANVEDEVVAPIGGSIGHFCYKYIHSLYSDKSTGEIADTDEMTRNNFASQYETGTIDPKYVSASVTITADNGHKITITGMNPSRVFRTGETVKKGEVLGYARYWYYKVPEPSIAVRISKNGILDPMSPFGLTSSYKKPKQQKQKGTLSIDEMVKDLDILIGALSEGYPGLYDYIEEHQFESIVNNSYGEVGETLKAEEFRRIVNAIIKELRDSHLAVLGEGYNSKTNNKFAASIYFGWLKDSLVVTRALPTNEDYIGRYITEIDGIPTDSLKLILSKSRANVDGFIESMEEYQLLTTRHLSYFTTIPGASQKKDLIITFHNGETRLFKGVERKGCLNIMPSWQKFHRYPDTKYSCNFISDSVAHLILGTFNLNEMEMSEIEMLFDTLSSSGIQHLIIDLRNNRGGLTSILSNLFSLIAKEPFKLEEYSIVNNNDSFSFSKYTTNYSAESRNLFPGYESIPGMRGFLKVNIDDVSNPNDSINFKGKVYVLANERSFSASTVFTSLVRKHQRGVVVGRETGSAYYHMNAIKYANLQLPSSGIEIKIPLIQSVFDTISQPSIPWGRGVIPDYPVNLTLEELSWENGDAILNHTLSLIANSKYLESQEGDLIHLTLLEKQINWIIVFAILIVASIVLVFVFRGKRHVRGKDTL